MSNLKSKKMGAIIFAILAALFYGINMPFSKMLLKYVPNTIMAGLLYLGAGIGIGVMFLFNKKTVQKEELLSKQDLPFTVGMIILDIAAPISLMYGLKNTTASNASLLNNFEIVATSIIALMIFKETISKRMWFAIFLITVSGVLLSVDDFSSLQFSWGSLFILLAALFWGFENNCTKKISNKNTYEIVTIKGLFSGFGSLMIGFIIGERLPQVKYIFIVLALGFVAYGLSIFFYIKAQNKIGAAKTSAYYSIAPFIGTFLSFIILRETFSIQFLIALLIMIFGSILVTVDILLIEHKEITDNAKDCPTLTT